MRKQAPTVFVSAPQGAGKSRHAETLRQLFGCTQIVDEWDGSSAVPPGSLVLTNIAPVAGGGEHGVTVPGSSAPVPETTGRTSCG